ncbi:MAG: cation diffusion facilitator family transporter, partial [Anaerolineales bacterium]
MRDRSDLIRFAWLSIAAAVLTIGIKVGGFLVSRSVGLLSDALESGVNLVAALAAFTALRIGAQPPDEEHAYGHQKVEYLSSGAEGGLIALAALAIAITAVQRLIEPQPIDRLGFGLGLSASASLINFGVAQVLLRVGRRRDSIALEADGQHLMTDVWTSIGVLVGVGMVAITGWEPLDPIVALMVAAWIAFNAYRILRRSALGLIDTAIPAQDLAAVHAAIDPHLVEGVTYHALRTRQAGARCFVSLHLQVPGAWSIQQGHDLAEAVERDIRAAVPSATVFTHIEPR